MSYTCRNCKYITGATTPEELEGFTISGCGLDGSIKTTDTPCCKKAVIVR